MFRHRLLATAAVTALAVLGLMAPAHAAAGPLADCLTLSPSTCYAPRQFLAAYGIQPLLDHGTDGRGETIVMPEFVSTATTPGVTDIRQDLATFDGLFGLPSVRLQVITRFGGASTQDLANGEEAGDVEIAHEVAPAAAIRVILLPETDVIANYTAALRFAASLDSVVSVTAGFGEACFTSAQVTALNAALRADQRRHVTVIASSGDSGAAIVRCSASAEFVKGVNLPASDPLVLSVGGTELRANHTTGAYIGETVWNTPPPVLPQGVVASNGGFSSLFARPAYQDGVPGIGAMRGVPDVAADADPATGMALAVNIRGRLRHPARRRHERWRSVLGRDHGPGGPVRGTAAGVRQPRDLRDRPQPPVSQRIPRHHQGNNTVVFPSGTVTGYSARPGWNPATGWGSPDAQLFVPLLAQPYHPRQRFKFQP